MSTRAPTCCWARVDEVERVAKERLPQNAEITWRGEAGEFKDNSALIYFSFALSPYRRVPGAGRPVSKASSILRHHDDRAGCRD